MLDYWVRLYRLYKLYQQNYEIEQVIIFLRPNNAVIEDYFQVGNTIHRYRVIKIWECDPTPLLQKPELLPLAVLGKSEQPEVLLSQVAERVDKIEDRRQKSNISACVELLAGINYSEELIKMYLHDDILKESVTYQNMLKTGEVEIINRQLKKRFGEVSETVKPKIQTLSREQVESLGESLFDFNSFDDVVNWLDNV
jgi:predicted transposase YdaD